MENINTIFIPIDKKSLSDQFIVYWRVKENIKFFNGHFPNNPVLPGVLIMEGSLEFLRKHLERDLILKKVISCKFMAPITPQMDLKIIFNKINLNTWNIDWIIKENNNSAAKLTIQLWPHSSTDRTAVS